MQYTLKVIREKILKAKLGDGEIQDVFARECKKEFLEEK